jgi:hypothetical protein
MRGCPVFPAPFVEKGAFSLTHVFDIFVKNQVALATWTYFWVFYSILLVCVSAFVPVPCGLCYYGFVV